ncbi:MAG: UDP-3-O-(3-hydroxymyristoyl)glucosamine N-acyltransferase [Granulosicoccus sp.]
MKLEQLGHELGIPVHGEPSHSVLRLAPIETAGPEDLAFVVSQRYSDALKCSRAGAVILPESMLADAPGNALISHNPYASYAAASWILYPKAIVEPGIHPTAVVHSSAKVSASSQIGPFVVIGSDSSIADNVVIEAHGSVGSGVNIDKDTRLMARVTIHNSVRIGRQCNVQSGAVIGSEGFGYAWAGDRWKQIQQVGGVRIGNNVHIGANTTIDCGAIEPTVIEDGVILDNQIQIAHNVHIGRNTAIAGCVGIAGSTHIGSHCQIGGACNIVGHLIIADQVVINAASLVTRSIKTKGRYGSGTPLQEEHVWRRSFINLGKLDAMFKRIRRLERQVGLDDNTANKAKSS